MYRLDFHNGEPGQMDQPQVQKLPEVFFEAIPADDLACDMAYAALRVTSDFCEQLRNLQKLCSDKALHAVHVGGAPDRWGPTEISANIYTGAGRELVISDQTFYFISDTHRAFKTAEESIDEFLAAMRVSDGSAFYFGKHIGELEELVERDADSDEDDATPGDSFSF